MKKHFWPNNWIFILAAIGSAAGLGNIWRFPYLAYEHGGAAFVLAFIIANLIIGIPLLVLETGLGQMTQKGASGAFAYIKKKFSYVGWAALTVGFIVLSYYMVVVSWGINYLGASLYLGWGGNTEGFFFNNILNLSSGVDVIGGISWPVLSGLIVAWVLIYLAVQKGVQSISKVVVWTATLPFAILAILILRAITLDGASDGLKLFLVPEWSSLADPNLWLAAFSQVFFSLSLAFGIMIAYGSLKRHDGEITSGVLWIAGGNFLVSIMSGFVVFGTLGYMAVQQGVSVSDVIAGGPSLAFVVFPQAINLLPAGNTLIALLFFGMFLLLAIDSAFSLLEAVAVSFKDKYTAASNKKIVLLLSLAGIASGVIFTTYGGLYILDIVDHFVVNYGLVVIGILEALIVGWLWKSKELEDFVNKNSKLQIGKGWNLSIRYITPLFLGWLLVWNIINELKTPYGEYPVWALLCIGVLPILLIPAIAFLAEKLTNRAKTGEENILN